MSTRVLPLPAPASTSTGPTGAVTAARCASFSDARMGDKSMGCAFYTTGARSCVVWADVSDRAYDLHHQADQHRADHEADEAKGADAADGADKNRQGGNLGVAGGQQGA